MYIYVYVWMSNKESEKKKEEFKYKYIIINASWLCRFIWLFHAIRTFRPSHMVSSLDSTHYPFT